MTRLGMVLYHGLESGPELESYARAAETAGYESLWVTERYFHEETFTLLGFLAAVTQRMKLGVGVTNPYTRHPALLAMASATLDRVSGGRFILGMGRSEPFIIRDRLGLDYRQPRTVLAEAVGSVRHLLAGERVDTAGQAGDPARHPTRHSARATAVAHLSSRSGTAGPAAGRRYCRRRHSQRLRADRLRALRGAGNPGSRPPGRDATPRAIDITCMLVVRLTPDAGAIIPRLKQRLVRLLAEPYVGEILLAQGGFDPGILGPLRERRIARRRRCGRTGKR